LRHLLSCGAHLISFFFFFFFCHRVLLPRPREGQEKGPRERGRNVTRRRIDL
jgi:hypothetical protein